MQKQDSQKIRGKKQVEDLDSGCDTEDEYIEGPGVKFPTFKMLDNMRDYHRELGTYFVSKKAFQEAIRTYAVHFGRDLKFRKKDKRRVRVTCKGAKGNCLFEAYCGKIPNEETWQLRKIQRLHKCSRGFKLKMLNSDWLGSKLHSRVRENQNLKLTTIMNRTVAKWGLEINLNKAYRARCKVIDVIDGSFREQYTRIYDYTHELLRSNVGSTVRVSTMPFQGNEEDVERPGAVLCPHFQRMYICFKACKDSFFQCRPVIGLDGCFLKGYYGGNC